VYKVELLTVEWLPTTELFLAQLWEAIHPPPGRVSYTVTEARPLLHEEAGNRLAKKTVSNTTLYAYACRSTQTVTTEHKRSDFMIAELDTMQPIQNRKQ